jgi:hypothetical protein
MKLMADDDTQTTVDICTYCQNQVPHANSKCSVLSVLCRLQHMHHLSGFTPQLTTCRNIII